MFGLSMELITQGKLTIVMRFECGHFKCLPFVRENEAIVGCLYLYMYSCTRMLSCGAMQLVGACCHVEVNCEQAK